MQHKVKRNLSIIVFVFALAMYYVLPTCLYYAQPLHKLIDPVEAQHIVKSLTKQTTAVDKEIIPRVSTILSALHLSGHIKRHSDLPGVVNVHFRQARDAQAFIEHLTYAEPKVPVKSARLHVLGYSQQNDYSVQVSGSLVTLVKESDFSFVPYAYVTDNENEKNISHQVLTQVFAALLAPSQDQCHCNYPSVWETAPVEEIVQYTHNLTLGLEVFTSQMSSFLNTLFPSNKDRTAFLSRLASIADSPEISTEDQYVCRTVYTSLAQQSRQENQIRPSITDQKIDCSVVSPFFNSAEFFPNQREVLLTLHPDLLAKRTTLPLEQRLDLESRLAREKQRLSKKFNARLEEHPKGFVFTCIDKEASGKIVLHGERLYKNIVDHLVALTLHKPHAESCDLIPENFPIYSRQPVESDSFGCFIFTPEANCSHFSEGSVYVVLKGLRPMITKYQKSGGDEYQSFEKDLQNLYNCFTHIDSTSWIIGEDQVLEYRQPLQQFFDVWGENFIVSGEGNSAFLEVKDIKDRLNTLNRIEKNRQSEWVQWHEEYRHAKCSMDTHKRLQTPIPHRNAFLENMKLNMRKYARGDNVLRLGIDFVGGRQLLLSFKDHRGQKITNKEDILKVSEELYARLNKLGVSEIEIRREGDCIHLSVPGSTKVSSSEILGTSQMSFHVVNEKFSPYTGYRYEVQKFLDYLWFLSQTQGATTPEAVNALASALFNNEPTHVPPPVHNAIAKLKQEGLAFSIPNCCAPSSEVDTTYSMIAIEKEPEKKANPLMIVFRNYALDGASLKNIRPEFAAGEGYILNFSVKETGSSKVVERSSSTDSFHAWTSAYCQDGVNGTINSQYSGNHGWRMAVIIDGYVVSSPVLNAPLRNHASVSGKFTHREVSKLAADLKSGAMSFVPEVLSEEMISPDLGVRQRTQGIVSACLGLAALIILMSVYYKFGGVIASSAVVLNLLLIWAALQYLDASLTLSGLAGIILAMGMAVDANILVFERIREEYCLSRSLSRSVETGYAKAFGAIFDSNLTTILASTFLLFLDTGPIKGFALTLILGIFSSMFTALFMTKFFFAMWMSKTQETQLHMMNKFIGIKHDFLKECKKLWIVSGSLIVLGCVALGFGAWHSVLGMDFKGGYAFIVDAGEQGAVDVSQVSTQVTNKLKQAGLSSRDFRIQTFQSSDKVKIYFSHRALVHARLNQNVNREVVDQELAFALGLLSETGLDFSSDSSQSVRNCWTKVSGQFSNKMRQQACIGLLGALAAILLYVSLRFEWRYAVSAVCGLLHDLIVTCAVLIATHFFLQKIQIDLQAIGALMTVLGYSLNNTLIIFDRIREDRQAKVFTSMSTLINDALQKTFSRTVMTTATTLSVLLILLFVGGGAVFNFAFIMTIGILLGTLSSLYIAPPFLLFMVRKEKQTNRNY
ncbi:protein translocase subunit SecDF [Candidatus Chlamydia sanziniae]|uniref:Protein-export membrane protein SecD n=1 Tax=Candidatus Chlamydia sanziniae TaxID=1806891 RepID=A0A1A9HVD1_9CHLA|nr:protein translocase subunit SecDF [Candidatus Chlamydia sanziniae]ANH78361.1 Protein-export membrane protein SecD [Candidatus Chlamydia sanziniae]